MFRFLHKFIFILLLVLPSIILLTGNDVLVTADEDEVESDSDTGPATESDTDTASDEDDLKVETDEPEEIKEPEPSESAATDETPEAPEPDTAPADKKTEAEATEEEEKEETMKPSPDADTVILFTKGSNQQLLAGEAVKVLVGFSNNGKSDFIVDTMEASLRYPQDFGYYIQNFTAFQCNSLVKPGHQATFEYAFRPHESFGGRPFGLVVNLLYKDTASKQFTDAVFNETINIVENDEGFDGETFFLYVFLAAIGLLVVMGGHYFVTSVGVGKKLLTATKPMIEMGTQQNTDIDYDWLPKETTTEFSGKSSPRRSPRNRRQKRNTGSDE